MTQRVTGIGGIFFKAKDPKKLIDWYVRHLGVPIAPDHPSAMFISPPPEKPDAKQFTVWAPFEADTSYFAPSESSFMVNFTVENLDELLKTLQAEGVELAGEPLYESYGKFAWIMDPEGNKVELWEPAGPPEE